MVGLDGLSGLSNLNDSMIGQSSVVGAGRGDVKQSMPTPSDVCAWCCGSLKAFWGFPQYLGCH